MYLEVIKIKLGRIYRYMVFSSLVFLFLFLPVMLITYYISPKKYRNIVLLIGSLIFYAYGGVKLLGVMIVSIMLNYALGILIYEYRWKKVRKRTFLILAILGNVGILAYFKYFNFFVDNYNALFGTSFVLENIIMPIGISFFTFHGLSYIFDVYNGDKPQRSIINMALYISLFPQLVAGPIVRYGHVSKQLIMRKENINLFGEGVERFIFGLGKKVLIANVLGEVADDIFQEGSTSTFLSWVGIIAYTFQIYYDFSGYSDMAIGLGKMFGFNFLENFKYPYISKSITEFWRRWHISLGSWFKDYVYFPLGGSRRGKMSTIINLLVVWMLTGLWHGANWTFVVWGLYFGIIIIIEKTFFMRMLECIPNFIRIIYTMLLVIVGWVIFRSENIESVVLYLKTMVGVSGDSLIRINDFFYVANYSYEFILAFLFAGPFLRNAFRKLEDSNIKVVGGFFSIVFTPVLLVGILYLSIMTLVNTSFNPFIYFRF